MAHDAKRAQRRERKREREGVECKRGRPGYSTEVAAPPKANAMNQAATRLTIRPKFSLSRGPARSSPNRPRRPRSQVPAPPGDILGNHLQDVRWGMSSAGCPLEDAPWRVPPGG